MGILRWLRGTSTAAEAMPAPEPTPAVVNFDIPGTLDLGWYWSENKQQYQMAKIAESDRSTHCYVIGASGSGKTKFLEFLIQQDIEHGNGFGVIDPHGDLVEEIKGLLACRYFTFEDDEEVRSRVVLVDPTDPNHTVTFNPLEPLPNVTVPEQVAELVSSFRKIWSDSWGVRMEDLMRNALIALGEAGLTLVELPTFLTSRPFRRSVLERVSHPIALDYFRARFDPLTDRAQLSFIEPVMNKVNAFLSDDRIRQMFAAEKSSFNVREVMDERKLLLVNLNKGKLKDSSDLVGSLIMAKIMMAAFSRSDVNPSKRTPFYLYIDEFQNFASDSFATVLSEARKYGLSLVMAHQTLGQISTELRSLILGNAGIQVCFRMNRSDAAMLAKEAFKYSGFEVKEVTGTRPRYWSFAEEWEHKTEDIRDLPPRSCYVKHKIQGGVIPLHTVEMVPATDVLDMTEEGYHDFLRTVPFGADYLTARSDLATRAKERVADLASRAAPEPAPAPTKTGASAPPPEHPPTEPRVEVSAPERTPPPVPPLLPPETAEPEPLPVPPELLESPKTPGKGGPKHRYLQTLVKRMAEERGFKATIEQTIPEGGLVDVGIERDGYRIACEISVTTGVEHELGNVQKCLAAGYDEVVVCCPQTRALGKLRATIVGALTPAGAERVSFLAPDELLFRLEEHAAKRASTEKRVKGYKVKVQYQPVECDAQRTAKREAVAQVIGETFRRMKADD